MFIIFQSSRYILTIPTWACPFPFPGPEGEDYNQIQVTCWVIGQLQINLPSATISLTNSFHYMLPLCIVWQESRYIYIRVNVNNVTRWSDQATNCNRIDGKWERGIPRLLIWTHVYPIIYLETFTECQPLVLNIISDYIILSLIISHIFPNTTNICVHFPRYWPFVRELISPNKGQWRGTLIHSVSKGLSKQ